MLSRRQFIVTAAGGVAAIAAPGLVEASSAAVPDVLADNCATYFSLFSAAGLPLADGSASDLATRLRGSFAVVSKESRDRALAAGRTLDATRGSLRLDGLEPSAGLRRLNEALAGAAASRSSDPGASLTTAMGMAIAAVVSDSLVDTAALVTGALPTDSSQPVPRLAEIP